MRAGMMMPRHSVCPYLHARFLFDAYYLHAEWSRSRAFLRNGFCMHALQMHAFRFV